MKWKSTTVKCLVLFLVVMAGYFACSRKSPPPQITWDPLEEREVDLKVQPLGWIPPGTVVGTTPPPGWSHLISVVHPRIRQGDLGKVSESVRDYACMLTINFLANVTQDPKSTSPRYHLEEVSLGIGTLINGKNTIITSNTQKELGADFDFFARRLLSHCESDFQDSFKQIARTSTMMVFESNSIFLVAGEHQKRITRHAVLVSPETGRLQLFIWLFDEKHTLIDQPIQALPPNFQEDQVLSVNPEEFTLGIPGEMAFAQVVIAQGTPIPWTDPLKSLGSLPRFTKESALKLERQLHILWVEIQEGR